MRATDFTHPLARLTPHRARFFTIIAGQAGCGVFVYGFVVLGHPFIGLFHKYARSIAFGALCFACACTPATVYQSMAYAGAAYGSARAFAVPTGFGLGAAGGGS